MEIMVRSCSVLEGIAIHPGVFRDVAALVDSVLLRYVRILGLVAPITLTYSQISRL
jgi:hypothetical protein